MKRENRLVEGLAGFGGKWGVTVNGVQGFCGEWCHMFSRV